MDIKKTFTKGTSIPFGGQGGVYSNFQAWQIMLNQNSNNQKNIFKNLAMVPVGTLLSALSKGVA